jgi:phospholipid-binding lipoprotein MlaA
MFDNNAKKMEMNRPAPRHGLVAGAALLATLAGCATTTADRDPRDPWEGWNRKVQKLNDTLDDYVMKPVAKGYKAVTPSILDQGITNFYNNVEDVGVIGNDVLQFKVRQTGQDIGRFLVNSTVGLGGMVDVASKMNLPKHNEDLDQTLGVWGIPSGPYLVLPVIGPSSPRGVVGVAGDSMSNPINWVSPVVYPWTTGALRIVDQRADLLSATRIIDEASVDRYEFIRNAFFQQRNYLIHDGNPPLDPELEREMELDIEGLEAEAPKGSDTGKAPAPANSKPVK